MVTFVVDDTIFKVEIDDVRLLGEVAKGDSTLLFVMVSDGQGETIEMNSSTHTDNRGFRLDAKAFKQALMYARDPQAYVLPTWLVDQRDDIVRVFDLMLDKDAKNHVRTLAERLRPCHMIANLGLFTCAIFKRFQHDNRHEARATPELIERFFQSPGVLKTITGYEEHSQEEEQAAFDAVKSNMAMWLNKGVSSYALPSVANEFEL